MVDPRVIQLVADGLCLAQIYWRLGALTEADLVYCRQRGVPGA